MKLVGSSKATALLKKHLKILQVMWTDPASPGSRRRPCGNLWTVNLAHMGFYKA